MDTKTNKGKPKLDCLGYFYVIEKPTKTTNYDGNNVLVLLINLLALILEGKRITWKCEKKICKGRGHSFGLAAPFAISQLHFNLPDSVRII